MIRRFVNWLRRKIRGEVRWIDKRTGTRHGITKDGEWY
jgi:hypothetical protein